MLINDDVFKFHPHSLEPSIKGFIINREMDKLKFLCNVALKQKSITTDGRKVGTCLSGAPIKLLYKIHHFF